MATRNPDKPQGKSIRLVEQDGMDGLASIGLVVGIGAFVYTMASLVFLVIR